MDLLDDSAAVGLSKEDEIDFLLTRMRHDRWWFHYLGPDPRSPIAIIAIRHWTNGYSDVLILHSQNDAIAYRTPHGDETDILWPTTVTDSYRSSARWTLRYALTCAEPGLRPHSPAPPYCGIHPHDRRLLTIRQGDSHIPSQTPAPLRPSGLIARG